MLKNATENKWIWRAVLIQFNVLFGDFFFGIFIIEMKYFSIFCPLILSGARWMFYIFRWFILNWRGHVHTFSKIYFILFGRAPWVYSFSMHPLEYFNNNNYHGIASLSKLALLQQIAELNSQTTSLKRN